MIGRKGREMGGKGDQQVVIPETVSTELLEAAA